MADPTAPTTAGRRVFPRLDMEVNVDLFSADTFFTGFTENISEGGLFIATSASFPLGERLRVRLSLMGGDPQEYLVVVCWVRPDGGINGLPGGMGVQFLDLPERERTRLQKFVDSGVKETLFVDLD